MSSIIDFFFNYGGWVFTPLHIVVCLILIGVVLLQTGKGADWAGVLGGGGTQTAFGPRGMENTLSRMTKWAAVMFMVTSLGLSLIRSKAASSNFNDLPTRTEAIDEAAGDAPEGSIEVPVVAPEASDEVAPAASDESTDAATEPSEGATDPSETEPGSED